MSTVRYSLLLVSVTAFCCLQPAQAAYSNSIFNAGNYPTNGDPPWWAVYPDDVPGIASNALILRQNTIQPDNFAKNVILGIANNQREAVAKAIGYMVNANSTVGGGCPVPPPPTRDLTRFGTAMATAINGANNKTALWVGQSLASVAAAQSSPNITVASLQAVTSVVVADTVIGGLFLAGKSCSPPNDLTATSQQGLVAKYLNATCFYAGPIIRTITLNNTRSIPAWNRTFTYDRALANQTDSFTTYPVLTAYQECVSGPIKLQAVPKWLYYNFGPVVSIDSSVSEIGSMTADTDADGAGAAAYPSLDTVEAAVPAEADSAQSSLLTQGGNQTGALQVQPSGQLAGR